MTLALPLSSQTLLQRENPGLEFSTSAATKISVGYVIQKEFKMYFLKDADTFCTV